MAEHPGEVGEITGTSRCLVLNLGNITDIRMEAMQISAKRAVEKGIPVVVDMVGIACSHLRRSFVLKLIDEICPTVLKGNYSEICALHRSDYSSSGVDADNVPDRYNMSKIAAQLAHRYKCIILASGATDIVTDGKKLFYITNGTPRLTSVTGTGCMLGVLCGCCMSVANDIRGAVTACHIMGICGALAATDKGNGTFMTNLIDCLSVISDSDIDKYKKVEEMHIEKF